MEPENLASAALARYVGFWWRLLAALLEVVLYLPFGYLLHGIEKLSFQLWSPTPILAFSFAHLAAWAWFLWRYQSTPGKFILGMTVKEEGRGHLRVRTVILRQYDAILLYLANMADQLWRFRGVRPDIVPSTWREIGDYYEAHESPWYWYVNAAMILLFVADTILIARTRKKQALHDFVAGTVVVHDRAWNWLWLKWRSGSGVTGPAAG